MAFLNENLDKNMRQLPEMSSHENLFASSTRQQEIFSNPLDESLFAAAREILVRTQIASVTNNNPAFLNSNLPFFEKLRMSYEQNMSNEFDTLRACETNRQISDLYNANLYNAPFSQPQFCPPTISPPILATTQATSTSAYPWFNSSISSSVNSSVNTSVNSQDSTSIEINKNVSINYANINNNDKNESDSNQKAKDVAKVVVSLKKKREVKSKKKTREHSKDAEKNSKSSRGRTKKNKKFTCLMCLKSFGYKHVLQNHERTHTGEKPFKCSQCHKRFTRDHHLKTHIRLHTGEKPYGCDHCERRFVQVANLRRHLRVHTGERPYKCSTCSAKFSDSNQLKTHRQSHGCSKTYKCAQCNLEFKKQQLLKKHKCGNFLAAPSTSQSQSDLSPQPSDELNDIEISSTDGQSEKSFVESNRSFTTEVPNIVDAVSAMSILPEQTEPEDLSMSTGMQKSQHSNSNDSFTSSRSFSSE